MNKNKNVCCLKNKCKASSTVTESDVVPGSNAKKNSKKKKKRTLSRLGRKSFKFCVQCNVILCGHCFDAFHSDQVPLPNCSPYLHLIQRPSRAVVTPPEQTTKISRSRTAPSKEKSTKQSKPANAARGAQEANVTSPNRMPRQKRMKQSKRIEETTAPTKEKATKQRKAANAARGAQEANVTSPNRMQRQKRMKQSKRNQGTPDSAALLDSPPHTVRRSSRIPQKNG